MSVPDEGYSRNTLCALNLISTFYYNHWVGTSAGGLLVFVSMLAIHFYETQLDQLPKFVLQLRVRNSSVKGREVKCLNAIAGGEGPRLYVL